MQSKLEPPNCQSESDGPTYKTVLYCLTRKETTVERIEEIRTALADVGYELREAGSENDKHAIVLPAEVDENGEGNEMDLEEMTKEELYEMASDQDLDGRSEMSKAELVTAIDTPQ